MTKRVKVFIGSCLIVLIGTTFFFSLSSEDITYYYTISEVLKKPEKFDDKKFRVMGLVEPESVSWDPQKLSLQFKIVETKGQTLSITYQGTKPDMFKEGQGVVVEGMLQKNNNLVIANQLLVKHSEEYKEKDHTKHKEAYYKSLQDT